MKRYLHYITAVAAVFWAISCTEEVDPAERETFEGRVPSQLEVSYSASGASVSSLNFNHSARVQEVEVSVNNDNLVWNLESNREWCKVVSDKQKGSGTVKLEISANESLEARPEAVLTFVAGEFRGFRITAEQSAAAFVLSQPYLVSPMDAAGMPIKVTTKTGTEWDIEGNGWAFGTKGDSVEKDGLTVTTVNINTEPNTSASRYGAVRFVSGQDDDSVWIYQFGNEYEYDDSGKISFGGAGTSTFSITAPAYSVREVVGPAFTSGSVTESEGGTATVTINLEENLSDCGEGRDIELSLMLANASSTIVPLPVIAQGYTPAFGLVTAKGLEAFAAAVAAGNPTSDWEKDGVVQVLQDIDMTGIDGWTGVGTEEHPFTGKFNGGGYAVLNLRNTREGIFHYCKGATVQNITLGKGSSLYYNSDYTGKACFGGIVSIAEGTAISGCSMAGDMEFAGTSENDDPAYIGGIVAWADATSSVKNAKTVGNIAVSTDSSPELTAMIGGVAGASLGTVSNCEMSGTINYTSGIGKPVIGGILPVLPEGATVANNSFIAGTISIGGTALVINVGGLYGRVESSRSFDFATDRSSSIGQIDIKSFQSGAGSEIYAGGFVGKFCGDADLSFKDYQLQTGISFDQTVKDRMLSYLFVGGALGGSDPEIKSGNVSFENITNTGVYSTAYATTAVTSMVKRCFVGGVAGFVNADKVSFKNCTNAGEIGKVTSGTLSANTKNYIYVYGGIAGVVLGGEAELTGCENKAKVTNCHYSNCIPGNNTDGWYSACISAGVLGAFDYRLSSVSTRIIIENCVNGGALASYRGCSGGIVGFARKAEINGCSNIGSMGQVTNSNAANKGGIACWLNDSKVNNSWATCDIFCSNPASAVQSPGGIVSISTAGGVVISGCSYFGMLNVNKPAEANNCGGIIATAESDTKVVNCRYGGSVKGVAVSENNLSTYVVGNPSVDPEVSGTTLWNGKM